MARGGTFTFLDSKDIEKKIERAKRQMELDIMRAFAGIVEYAFVYLVQETPQWSGYLAASWNMSINRRSLQTADKSKYPWVSNPYQKGMDPAVRDALSRAEGKTDFKLRFSASGWLICVYNGVPYADKADSGGFHLRSEVGHSPGFVQRFIDRVESAQANQWDGSWHFYAHTNFLGAGQGR